jgi:hypothetical protein
MRKKWTDTGLLIESVHLSACFNLNAAARISMKFGIYVMSFQGTLKKRFRISYNQ